MLPVSLESTFENRFEEEKRHLFEFQINNSFSLQNIPKYVTFNFYFFFQFPVLPLEKCYSTADLQRWCELPHFVSIL